MPSSTTNGIQFKVLQCFITLGEWKFGILCEKAFTVAAWIPTRQQPAAGNIKLGLIRPNCLLVVHLQVNSFSISIWQKVSLHSNL